MRNSGVCKNGREIKWEKGMHKEKVEYDKLNFEIVEEEIKRESEVEESSFTHTNVWSCSWHTSLFDFTCLTKAHFLIDWLVCHTWRLAALWSPTPLPESSPHIHTLKYTLLDPSLSLLPRVRTGTTQRGDGRQAEHTEWPTEEGITHQANSHTNTQAELEWSTHTQKAWSKIFHLASYWWQLFLSWYSNFLSISSWKF